MNWEYIKHKQIYFVEYKGEILKFKGFDSLDNWIKLRNKGEKWILNIVSAVSTLTKKV